MSSYPPPGPYATSIFNASEYSTEADPSETFTSVTVRSGITQLSGKATLQTVSTQSPLTISNATGHPTLNLAGIGTQYGTVQFQDNTGATQATQYCSSTTSAVNIDTQGLTNGLQVSSYGTPYITANTSSISVSVPSTVFSGNITQNSSYNTTLRTTTISGTATVSRIVCTGNCSVTGATTLTRDASAGNITASGTVLVDSLQVHPVAGSTASFSGNSSYNINWPVSRRSLTVVVTNLNSAGSPILWFYGSSGTGNITYAGYTNGNNAGAQTAWASGISLYNTTWAGTYYMNFHIDFVQLSTYVFMARRYGHRIDGNYYVAYFGTITFINSATMSYFYLSGSGMSCNSISYSSNG